MKKLLVILALFLVGCTKPETEVKYDFVYASSSPTGGIEFFKQTKYTIIKTKDLPDTDAEWILFISQLEYIHDLEDGILDDLYYGHVFFLENFWW